MSFSTLVAGLALMSTTGWAQTFVLEDDLMADGNFFNQFSFWDSSDPTNGFVDYVSQDVATQNDLLSSSAEQVTFGVDHTNTSPNGRMSVRLTSNKAYDSGLVIADIAHMPGGICGTWPAFWMVGPDWPSSGEIDIIEGVNDQSTNDMTLHTGPGCSIDSPGQMLGSVSTNNCDVNAAGQAANQGCQITTTDTATYGAGFNANNGGVYATNWDSDSISIYFFPRNSIPSDITSGSPDPSSWGSPMAHFQGGCDIATSFKNLQIVFDTTFCGDWAGAAWGGSCASKADTCNAFVQNNPSAFEDAYWAVNGLKVYSSSGSTSSNLASSSAAASSVSVPATIPNPVTSASSTTESTSQTTFAVSAKPTFSAGNSSDAPFASGSGVGTGTAAMPTSTVASTTTAISTAIPSSAVSVAAASSSPPEAPPATTTAVPAPAPTDSQSWSPPAQSSAPWLLGEHDGGQVGWSVGPPKEKFRRHLQQHKRHRAGRL